MDNISTQRRRTAAQYNAVFNINEDGEQVLTHLWDTFIDSSAKQPLDALQLAYQEGQRSVVRHIRIMANQLDRENTERQQQERDAE